MKAFLSHSSKDKALVEEVARFLGGASVELDQNTFDFGELNSEAIADALDRSDLFVLFISSASILSPIVRFEARLAQELYVRGALAKMLFVCLDSASFDRADAGWKNYNIVRHETSAKTIARLIQSTLLDLRAQRGIAEQPFVGRSEDLDAAKERLIDPDKPRGVTSIFVSGNTGVGRRTFARHLYRDVFPEVKSSIAEIAIEDFDGLDELYRKILDQVVSRKTFVELTKDLIDFSNKTDDEKISALVDATAQLQRSRDAIILRDHGGLLNENGSIRKFIQDVIERLDAYPFPPVILVTERTPPQTERSKTPQVVYCPLSSLSPAAVRQLIAMRLRQLGVKYEADQLNRLVELSDAHPFNVNFMMEAINAYTLQVFLANPTSLIVWKNKRTSEFVESIVTNADENIVLSVLRNFPALDFNLLSAACELTIADTAMALASLMDKHLIENGSDTYFISPPLKGAIDRSRRFALAPDRLRRSLQIVSASLNTVDAEAPVPVSMVEAGILASLQADDELPAFVEALLLPSQLVWLARRRYDERHFDDCIKLANDALGSLSRLSLAGRVEACRLLCLSAARVGNSIEFDKGLKSLKSIPAEKWINSTVNFLLGFNARLAGNLPEAEGYQRQAYDFRPGNFSAARELAFICLNRGKIEDAEQFARSAFSSAPDNPYILDILAGVLIQLVKKAGQAQTMNWKKYSTGFKNQQMMMEVRFTRRDVRNTSLLWVILRRPLD